MKITKIECIPVTFRYKKPRVFARVTSVGTATESLVVKLHTDEGIIGVGEIGRGNLTYSGDSVGSMMSTINDFFGPQILLGEDPFNIEKIVAKMEMLGRYSYQTMAIIDCALHDIVGKKLGVPVYKLLGGLSIEKIPMGYVLYASNKTPKEVGERAVEILEAGFHSIKFKVARPGVTVEEDLEYVKAIREAIGPHARLGIDANAGWDYYQALEALKKMQKFDLCMIEQPVPWWDIDGLARLREKVDIAVFADESAQDLAHVMQIIQKNAVDGLFLKVGKVGGLLKAQQWVAIAKAAGLPVMCGCMVGSGFEGAAQAHFLVANEWMSRLEHENLGVLAIHDRLETVSTPIKDDLAIPVPRVENGFMYPPDGPGLGVELNEAVLPQLMTPGKSPTVIGK